MKQRRLQAICDFLKPEDKIIDVGCDHAYVSIEMAKNGNTKILASDIHQSALDIAIENIKKANLDNKISTILSDGLEKINTNEYNTVVIAGMGTSTIMHILSDEKKMIPIQKIILQSNNELPLLRKYMQEKGYALVEEKILKEKKHYYVIMKYQKGNQNLSEAEIYFGLYKKENRDYYTFLEKKYLKILEKTSNTKINYEYMLLKKYL